MTTKEINEAVARKLGWKVDPDHGNCLTRGYLADLQFLNGIPDYCTSIAAAWEVVEHMCKTNNAPILWFEHFRAKSPKGPKCCISFQYDEMVTAILPAPMAIALAFLKLPDA